MKFVKKAKYIKYTRSELEKFTSDDSSCVKKIHAREHLGISMAGIQNLRETISQLLDHKIGRFDQNRNGIVLDIRNTKVLNTPSQIRHDSADLHLDIESDFYVFQPRLGAVVTGVVKHISQSNVGVIIYRVFNVAVRFTSDLPGMRNVKVNQEIKIRVMNFDLDNRVPEIEGELVIMSGDEKIDENDGDSGISTEEVGIKIKRERDSDDHAGPSSEMRDSDAEPFTITKKRRSILVKPEGGRRKSLPKHVSFNDTPISIKVESEQEKETPSRRRLRSPSPPPKLDETEFNTFEQLIENDLQSTLIGAELVTVKTEPNPNKSSKKRKRDTDEEETPVSKKKKKTITIKQEPEESSSQESKSKKKDKKKATNNSFFNTLESILDEAEMSSSSSTQTPKTSKHKKVPKIKKEKF